MKDSLRNSRFVSLTFLFSVVDYLMVTTVAADSAFIELWERESVNLINSPGRALELLNESSDAWSWSLVFQEWSTAKSTTSLTFQIPLMMQNKLSSSPTDDDDSATTLNSSNHTTGGHSMPTKLNSTHQPSVDYFPCLLVALLIRTDRYDEFAVTNPKFRIEAPGRPISLKPFKQKIFWIDNHYMWKLYLIKAPNGSAMVRMRGVGTVGDRRAKLMADVLFRKRDKRLRNYFQYYVEAYGMAPLSNLSLHHLAGVDYNYDDYDENIYLPSRDADFNIDKESGESKVKVVAETTTTETTQPTVTATLMTTTVSTSLNNSNLTVNSTMASTNGSSVVPVPAGNLTTTMTTLRLTNLTINDTIRSEANLTLTGNGTNTTLSTKPRNVNVTTNVTWSNMSNTSSQTVSQLARNLTSPVSPKGGNGTSLVAKKFKDKELHINGSSLATGTINETESGNRSETTTVSSFSGVTSFQWSSSFSYVNETTGPPITITIMVSNLTTAIDKDASQVKVTTAKVAAEWFSAVARSSTRNKLLPPNTDNQALQTTLDGSTTVPVILQPPLLDLSQLEPNETAENGADFISNASLATVSNRTRHQFGNRSIITTKFDGSLTIHKSNSAIVAKLISLKHQTTMNASLGPRDEKLELEYGNSSNKTVKVSHFVNKLSNHKQAILQPKEGELELPQRDRRTETAAMNEGERNDSWAHFADSKRATRRRVSLGFLRKFACIVGAIGLGTLVFTLALIWWILGCPANLSQLRRVLSTGLNGAYMMDDGNDRSRVDDDENHYTRFGAWLLVAGLSLLSIGVGISIALAHGKMPWSPNNTSLLAVASSTCAIASIVLAAIIASICNSLNSFTP